MNRTELYHLAITAGVLGVIAVLLHKTLFSEQNQPEKAYGNPVLLDTSMYPKEDEHFVPLPGETWQPADLPVKYPPRAGHELSCLIENGYDPLFHPRSDLFDWVSCPPSEEA